MSWIARSQPPEPDFFPASDPVEKLNRPPPQPPDRVAALIAERAGLLERVRPRVRSRNQERIRRRIAAITLELMTLTKGQARDLSRDTGK